MDITTDLIKFMVKVPLAIEKVDNNINVVKKEIDECQATILCTKKVALSNAGKLDVLSEKVEALKYNQHDMKAQLVEIMKLVVAIAVAVGAYKYVL